MWSMLKIQPSIVSEYEANKLILLYIVHSVHGHVDLMSFCKQERSWQLKVDELKFQVEGSFCFFNGLLVVGEGLQAASSHQMQHQFPILSKCQKPSNWNFLYLAKIKSTLNFLNVRRHANMCIGKGTKRGNTTTNLLLPQSISLRFDLQMMQTSCVD